MNVNIPYLWDFTFTQKCLILCQDIVTTKGDEKILSMVYYNFF